METEKVLNRKKELIKRDPLFREVSETFQKIRQSGERSLSIEEAVRDICSNLKEAGGDYFAKYQAKYPDHRELELLAGSISAKWQVFLMFDFNSPDGILITPLGIYNETIFVGNPSTDRHPEMNWAPYPNHLNREPITADIHTMLNQTYDGKRERCFPILIYPDRINSNDAKGVKKHIWEIVKSHLQKGGTKKPIAEYPECEPLYSVGEEKFQNYLRWYDLHMEENKDFRSITLLERKNKKKDNIKKYEEDRIRKGFKLIYQAIHRTSCPKKDILLENLETYTCALHQNDCPITCANLKNLIDKTDPVLPKDDTRKKGVVPKDWMKTGDTGKKAAPRLLSSNRPHRSIDKI